MRLGTQIEFILKDVPVQEYQDIYIILQGDGKIIQSKMLKDRQFFQSNHVIKPQTLYRYKYKICEQNQIVKEEKGFRNYTYKRNNNQQNMRIDCWNKKEVILKIQTTENTIMKTLKIVANQKLNQRTIIKKDNVEVKQVTQNNISYYEGTIQADCGMEILELEFNFNAIRYGTNQKEEAYTKKKSFCYCDLRTIGKQSFLEISGVEFDQISKKEVLLKKTSFNLETISPNKQNPYFSLQNDNIQILLKLYENSLKYFQENLEKKDQQIKQLQMEKLEDDIICFNLSDKFSLDIYNQYCNQFNSIVEDYKKYTQSYLIQLKDQQKEHQTLLKENQQQQSSLKEYKENISNNEKTIESLKEKVTQLKNNQVQNEKQIENLKNKIEQHQEMLKKKRKIIEELEKQLNDEKQQNQKITQEKDQFKNQILELDKEFKVIQQTKEELEDQNYKVQKENKKINEEKENIIKEKQKIQDDLIFQKDKFERKEKDLNQSFVLQGNQLKFAKKTITSYTNSVENQNVIIKESRKILVDFIQNNLKDLTNIISSHKQLDLKTDAENLIIYLNQFNQYVNNFLEEKILLESIENFYQSDIQKSLNFFCQSDRIKEKENSQIQDIQIRIKTIFLILHKFNNLKNVMPQPQKQIIIQNQQQEVNIVHKVYPNTVRSLKRFCTLD